tara:strand:+ start:582 stop:1697 length:1116 start_codon:yes stop_codon:yes gene_type:complete
MVDIKLMKKKITYISNSSIPSMEANSVHVVNMANALCELNMLDDFFAYKGFLKRSIKKLYGLKKNLKISFYFLSPAPIFNSIEMIITSFRLKKNTIIFGRHIKICLFLTLLGKPVIFETHQPISSYSFIDKLLFKYTHRKLIAIISITHALKRILLDEFTIKDKKIIVLPDAANLKIKKIKLSSKRKKIGYFGSLLKGRGIDIIFSVAKDLEEIEFHIAGGSEFQINKLSMIKTKNIFFHGYLDEDRLISLRNKMDILLAPYQNNTSVLGGKVTTEWMSPLKIFEYMSSKIPFIASDIKVLREVLKNRYNCILVNPNSINEWKTAIKKIFSNEKLSEEISNNAFNDFISKYTWEIRAKKILEICSKSSDFR